MLLQTSPLHPPTNISRHLPRANQRNAVGRYYFLISYILLSPAGFIDETGHRDPHRYFWDYVDEDDEEEVPVMHTRALKEGEDKTCAICLNEMVGVVVVEVPGCGHIFHGGCLREWLKGGNKTCPMCRGKIKGRVGVEEEEEGGYEMEGDGEGWIQSESEWVTESEIESESERGSESENGSESESESEGMDWEPSESEDVDMDWDFDQIFPAYPEPHGPVVRFLDYLPTLVIDQRLPQLEWDESRTGRRGELVIRHRERLQLREEQPGEDWEGFSD